MKQFTLILVLLTFSACTAKHELKEASRNMKKATEYPSVTVAQPAADDLPYDESTDQDNDSTPGAVEPGRGIGSITDIPGGIITPTKPKWWCRMGNGTPCTTAQKNDPIRYRQVVVLPTGFQASEYNVFSTEFDRLLASLRHTGSNVFSGKYKDRIAYIAYWVPGGALGTPTSAFEGRVAPHPIRPLALAMKETEAFDKVEEIKRTELNWLAPWSVLVLFNTLESGITANAAPPSSIRRAYGIAKITRDDLTGSYTAAHELGHSALNFVDEYIEEGLENVDITDLDYATPFVLSNGSWEGFKFAWADILSIYDLDLSDILAANGNENTDVSRYVSRVSTSGYSAEEFKYAGGMFFGKGVYHHAGLNLMNSDFQSKGADDGYGLFHNGSQQSVVDQVFENPWTARRPNDRLRNAGPTDGWPSALGSETSVMIFDADKNHHYHKTQSYDVQVGWYERDWKVCYGWGWVPYPCYDDVWTVWQKNVSADLRTIDLLTSNLFGVASLVQKALCALGVNEISTGSGAFQLCESDISTMATTFLPSVQFSMPYQEIDVACSQWATTYYWRFRTKNGTWTSGWTGWSDFVRTL